MRVAGGEGEEGGGGGVIMGDFVMHTVIDHL